MGPLSSHLTVCACVCVGVREERQFSLTSRAEKKKKEESIAILERGGTRQKLACKNVSHAPSMESEGQRKTWILFQCSVYISA